MWGFAEDVRKTLYPCSLGLGKDIKQRPRKRQALFEA